MPPLVADPVTELRSRLRSGALQKSSPCGVAQDVAAEPPARAQLPVREVLLDRTVVGEADHLHASRVEARIDEGRPDVLGRREVTLRRRHLLACPLNRA